VTDLSTEQMHRLMPFSQDLGIRLVSAAPDEVVGELAWTERLTTTAGLLHGGALMTLADCIGGTCAFLNLPTDAATSTTSSSTVFLRGLRDGVATATARPLHVGRSTIAVEVDVTDANGRRLARTTATQAVLTATG
jgi:1,4-dihydroxy-2-naphthoyl-CoA hydrolase